MHKQNKRPLIAHVIFSLGTGGLENGLVNLINHIPEEKYSHVIICLKQSSDFSKRLKRQDIQIFELNKNEGQDWGSFIKMYRILKQINPDIIHTRNLAALEYQVPAYFAGVKCRIHGEHGWEVFDPEGKNAKYQWLRRMIQPFVHRFIPLSVHLEHYLTKDVGIAARKVSRICNGVDTEKFHPLQAQQKSQGECPFAFSPDKIYIGTVGRMHGVKDQITLVKAFITLIDENPALKNKLVLILIGDGPLRADAEKLLHDSHLEKQAWLPGNRDDIAEIMHYLDVFVLPSQAEGISNTILEAMATGLPVIATRVGGNPELIKEGFTGSLVEKENPSAMAVCLLSYIQDKSMREQRGANARKRIMEEFSLQVMVNNYTNVYDAVITEIK